MNDTQCITPILELEITEETINDNSFLLLNFISSNKIPTLGIREGNAIVNAFEYAKIRHLPVITLISSGGIRIQEGTTALMQMIRITSAINLHSQENLLYICVIKNTTLGGVSASLVALADIIISLPNQIFGFTGKRIILETTREKLDESFQTAEFSLKHGMIDMIIEEKDLWKTIGKLLRFHHPNKTL